MTYSFRNYLRWLVVFALIWTSSTGCGKSDSDPEDVTRMADSFHFMDIGANTVIDSDVRNRLIKSLGSEAVDRKTTIDLDLKYKGFLTAYYPGLSVLNQKLNVNDMVRKEYPATRLTFRNTGDLFNVVEFIYADDSGCPLLIKMIAKKEIPDLIGTLEKRYGDPQKIPIEDGRGVSLSWTKEKDVFVVARFPGNYKRPEHHMMIVYVNRLEQLLSREADSEADRKGEGAEKVF